MTSSKLPGILGSGPFTVADADRVGLGRSALRTREWRQVFRGVWVHVDIPDDLETRFAAARLALPPLATACGLTAAWLHGADVRRQDDLDVHVSFPRGRRVRPRPGLVVSQETLDETDVWLADGVRLTSPTRTAFDCLRLLRDPQGIVVADALTQSQRTSVDELARYFAGQRRLRNLRIGERLLDDVEPKSESPMESRLRVSLVRHGLPRPQAQWELRDRVDNFVARLDLAYPDQRVAVEYDGAWHWKQRREDDRRRDAARRLDWEVVVADADDVFKTPERLCAEVRALLRSRSASAAASPTAS
jgi:very-short-patch-repair endonuclease